MDATIDGISCKRRNGSRGVARMTWYANYRSIRFAQHFCPQLGVTAVQQRHETTSWWILGERSAFRADFVEEIRS